MRHWDCLSWGRERDCNDEQNGSKIVRWGCYQILEKSGRREQVKGIKEEQRGNGEIRSQVVYVRFGLVIME